MDVSVDNNVSEAAGVEEGKVVAKHSELKAGGISTNLHKTSTRAKQSATTRIR